MKHSALIFFLAIAGCAAPTAPVEAPAAAPVAAGDILGSWKGCDGRIIEFARAESGIIGRYAELGQLGQYGFTIGEEGYRMGETGSGTFEGEVKWRFTDGRVEWRPLTVQITGDQYEDSGSDECGKSMTRVSAP